jgi:hypothetical protein
MTVRELIEALVPFKDEDELFIRVPDNTSEGVYTLVAVERLVDGRVVIDLYKEASTAAPLVTGTGDCQNTI